MIDLIAHNHGGDRRPSIKCLDHGFVSLVDSMPRLVYEEEGVTTADFAIVQAARVSYGVGTKKVNEDRGLVRYLMRHRHTTPNEMVEFKFHCAMPVFIARQWIRHRTANVNEMSGRYSVLPDKFYQPDADNVRKQSTKNKQVSEGSTEEGDAQWFLQKLESISGTAYGDYLDALNRGIGKEQARMVLPLNLYTEWYWKIDLHNLLHFLALRCDGHAQQEIQVFGNAMLNLIKPIVPWVIEAWEDYHPMRGGMLLTRLEIEALKNGSISSGGSVREADQVFYPADLNTDNSREVAEWNDKVKRLGF
jgi:thymidylate synthase (FAD)